MKTTFIIPMTRIVLIVLMVWTCPVWADDIDDALPENTSLQIRNNTRQMVQAGFSKADATQLTRAMLQHHFQEKYAIQAQNMLTETMHSGLPVAPMMNKAFEGMAKNKPDTTIVQAMKKTQSRYAYAYRKAEQISTGSKSRNNIANTIAQGLGAGLQNQDIDRIMTQMQVRSRSMTQHKAEDLCLQTFMAARVMARLGVDPDKVSNMLSLALQNQFTAKQMQQVRMNFKNRSHQTAPNQLANQFSQQLGPGGKSGNSNASDENGAGQSGSGQGSASGGNDGDGSGSGTGSGGAGGAGAGGAGNSGEGSGSGGSGGNSGN